MASVITYWQESVRLAGDVGVCGEAARLPQDQATAVVVIGAILVRNFGSRPPALWCGMYRAELVLGDGSPMVVRATDARVVLARQLMADASGTSGLAGVREAILAAQRAGELELADSAGERVADQAAGWTTPSVPPISGAGASS